MEHRHHVMYGAAGRKTVYGNVALLHGDFCTPPCHDTVHRLGLHSWRAIEDERIRQGHGPVPAGCYWMIHKEGAVPALTFIFTIDGQAYEAQRLTSIAWVILAMAGKGTNTHYLTLRTGDRDISYRDRPEAMIVLGDALEFTTHTKEAPDVNG